MEIGTGLGLYLVRMNRNGVSSIIMNTFSSVLQVSLSANNPNDSYISFSKVSQGGGVNFYINEIGNESTEDQRKIVVRKVF